MPVHYDDGKGKKPETKHKVEGIQSSIKIDYRCFRGEISVFQRRNIGVSEEKIAVTYS